MPSFSEKKDKNMDRAVGKIYKRWKLLVRNGWRKWTEAPYNLMLRAEGNQFLHYEKFFSFANTFAYVKRFKFFLLIPFS